MKEKKHSNPHPDPVTGAISEQLNKIPYLGSGISRIYLWKYNLINTMIVGASGMILTFLLYEGFFRILLIGIWGGAFLGMVITTFLVFFWNYLWNRHWSLSIDSQLYSMKTGELMDLRLRALKVLKSKLEAEDG